MKETHERLLDAHTPDWEKEIYRFIVEWYNPADHIMLKTSGSTGIPKEITLRKKYMEHSARQTLEFFGISQDHELLLCLPAQYIGGKMMIVRAIVADCNLVAAEPSANPFENMEKPVDFAAVTPYQLSHSLKTLSRKRLVNTLIVGGGELHADLEKAVQDISVDVFATYGMTETSSHIALRPVNGTKRQSHFSVIGNTKIEKDRRGCLVIFNHDLFDGKVITNDIVAMIDDRSFEWLGRFDNIINTGGIKVIPEEVELKIREFVKGNIVVTSVESKYLGQEIVLLYESVMQGEEGVEDLQEQINSALPTYQKPRQIYRVRAIPQTPNGKTDRLAAKKLAKKLAAKTRSDLPY